MSASRTKPNTYDSVLAACTAGLIETTAFHPTDTMIKRLQNNIGKVSTPQTSYWSNWVKIIFADSYNLPNLYKFTSLYDGLKWGLIYKGIIRGYKLGMQPTLQGVLEKNCGPTFDYLFGDASRTMTHAVAGALLGAGEVFTLPMEAMKIKSQTRKKVYSNLSLLQVAKHENLFAGLGMTVSRNIIGSGVLFSTPYLLKTSVLEHSAQNKLSNVESASIAVIASTLSIVITSPWDTVKTRMQAEPPTMTGTRMAFNMFKNEGILSYFKGSALKITTGSAKLSLAMFLTDKLIEVLSNYREQKPEPSIPRKLC